MDDLYSRGTRFTTRAFLRPGVKPHTYESGKEARQALVDSGATAAERPRLGPHRSDLS